MMFNKKLAYCFMLSHFCLASAFSQSLQEAVQLTLNENPEVQEARSSRMAIEQEINQAGSRYLPSVDVSAGYGLEQANNFNTRGRGLGTSTLGRLDTSVQVQQMVFDGFLTPNEVDRVTAKTDAQAYTVFGQAEYSGLQATQAYINVLRRENLLALAADNLNLHKSIYEQINMRTQRGIGRVSDLDQAKGRLARAETNQQTEVANLKDAQTSFLRVIGVLPQKLQDVPVPTKAIPASLEEATELALAEHPSLKAANAEITESLAFHDASAAPFYPKLNLAVEYDNNQNNSGIRGLTEDLTAMARISYNLFNGGKDLAKRKQAAYQMSQAKNVRDKTYRQVVETIRLAWVSYQTLNNQLAFFKAHRDSSMKALEAYKQQFNMGQRTLLDVLDSTNEMYLANQAFNDAKFNELAARYKILAAMGRLNRYLGSVLPPEVEPITPDQHKSRSVFTAAADKPMQREPATAGFIKTDFSAETTAEAQPAVTSEKPVQAEPDQPEKKQLSSSTPDVKLVKQRLSDWAAAWSSGDVGAYLAYYTPDFSPNASLDHDTWKNQRAARISPDKHISVALADVQVDQTNENIIKTTFQQSYRSNNFQDITQKVLLWRKIKDMWFIQAENSL